MTTLHMHRVHQQRLGLVSMFAGIVAIPTAILALLFTIAKALH